MRNLQPYKDNSRDFIKEIISSSKDAKKSSCQAIMKSHGACVSEYDKAFDCNRLEKLIGTHPTLSTEEKNVFKSLYSYDRVAIVKLRHELLTDNDGYENEYCPICEVNLVQTMDHFIPQAQYPLFVVHPKNLIPCCQTCNQHKSEKTLDDNGKRYYWNAFLDTIPTDEFLHCRITERNGLPFAKFYLQQGKIDANTFRLIKNTMEGQCVLKTYEAGSGAEIQLITNCTVRYIKNDNCTHTLSCCIQQVREQNSCYAETNNWKNVLSKELLMAPVFIKCLKEELTRRNIPFLE